MKKQNARIGAIYSRVSDAESAAKDAGSLSQQEHMGREIAQMLSTQTGVSHEIRFVLTEEEGVSGGTTRRPQYQRLINLVAHKRIDFVIAKEISRLSRSTKDFCEFMEHCRMHGVSVHIKGLDVDFNQPFGELIYKLLALIAEFERKLGQERTRSGIRSGMLHHAKIPGPPVLGFDKSDKPGQWTPNGIELKTVEHILEEVLKYDNLPAACSALRKQGIKNKSGNFFRPDSIRRLINNRKYKGILEVNIGTEEEPKTEEVKLPFGPVVDLDKLHAAREKVLELSKRFGKTTRTRDRNYLLTGLLQTKDGEAFHGAYGTSKTGQKRYYYRVAGRENFSVPADELEKHVIATLGCYKNQKEFHLHMNQIIRNHSFKSDFYIQRLNALKGRKDDLDKKEKLAIDHLLEVQDGSDNLAEALNKRLAEIKEERQSIESVRTKLEKELNALEKNQPNPKNVKDTLEHVLANFKKAEPSTQRELLRRVFARLVVHPDYTVEVFWKDPCGTGGQEFEYESKTGG